MMPIAGSAQLSTEANVLSHCHWTIYEKQTDGSWELAYEGDNLQTNYGLTAFASALGGHYTAPLWLVIDDGFTTQTSLSGTTLVAATAVHKSGDTQLVLSIGTANQETVTFTGTPSGTTPCTYTLSGTPSLTHTNGDKIARAVRVADTVASINHELQYDSTLFPGQRTVAVGDGFSTGTGNYTMQFVLTGTEAVTTFAHLGLADDVNVGAGNLHNFLVSGYTHASAKDLQINVSITLANA